MDQTKNTTLSDLENAFKEVMETNPLLALHDRELNGVNYKVFANAPKTMRDLFDVIGLLNGDFPFIHENGNEHSYLEAIQKAKNLAGFLSEKGIKPGDSVGICMQNCTEWIIAYLGIAAHGATCVPLNSWWRGDELKYGVEHSELKLLFVDEKRYQYTQDLDVLQVLKTDSASEAITFNDAIQNACTDWPEKNATDEDVSVLLYTSGSTGLPKGVMLTHLSVANAILGFYTLGELRGLVKGETLLAVDNAKILLNIPLFHVTGLITIFLLSTLAKRQIVIMNKWDTSDALNMIQSMKITNISGVPTQSWDLLNHPNVDEFDLSSLIDIGAGGAARPEDQVQSLHEKFNLPLTFGWGMTETCALGAINRGDEYLAKPNSSGLNVPYLTEVAVTDENWNFLNSGEVGEIVFKSPTNTIGYLKNNEETEKALKDGWLLTGDLGYIDDEGYLFIVDRKKSLIIRGGENISTLEVENALDRHANILESCVCGIDDPKFGEIVGAYIYCNADVSEEAIKGFLNESIAGYKVPEVFHISKDPLPRIATEKIDRVGIKKILSSQ